MLHGQRYSMLHQRKFPAAQFFNVPDFQLEYLTKYLCNVKPDEPKCCSCDGSNCYQDCCTDVHWNMIQPMTNLSQYLENIVEIDKYDFTYETCHPIIFPLRDGHQAEYYTMDIGT